MKKVIDLSFACSFLSVVFFLNFVIFTFSNAYELLEGFIIDEKYLTSFHKSLKNSCNNNNLNKIRQHSSYPKFGSIEGWKKICEETKKLKKINKIFFYQNFHVGSLSEKRGLLTGYYEPEINVSKKKTSIFKIPILKYDSYYKNKERKNINKSFKNEHVLLWTDSLVELFFLQIQGSGMGVFKDNTRIKINYSNSNNLEYKSIGKLLYQKKLITGDINLFSIKDYFVKNPNKIKEILNYNKRYIFFELSEKVSAQSKGAFGLELNSFSSVAVDKNYYPLGIPLLLKTSLKKSLPVVVMDRGSAIMGVNRADLFTGRGHDAEKVAGKLKEKLIIYFLIPREKK